MFKRALRVGVVAAACLGTTVVAAAPSAPLKPTKPMKQVVTVTPKDINQALVPNELVGGDREFGGNGPRIESKVILNVSPDKRSIVAKIYFNAKETKHDWSETRGSWERVVYRAPAGKKIHSIESPTTSVVSFTSKPAGFQLLGPTADYLQFFSQFQKVAHAVLLFGSPSAIASTPEQKAQKQLAEKVRQGIAYLKSRGNHVHVMAPSSGPVATFAIVGDTGGPDISTDLDPNDDTRIEAIKLKPVKITFE